MVIYSMVKWDLGILLKYTAKLSYIYVGDLHVWAYIWTRHDLYRSLTKPKSQTCLLHVEELWVHITRFTRKIMVGIIPVIQSLLWGFRGLDEVTGASERTSFRLTQRHLLEEEGFGFHTSSSGRPEFSWTSKVENTKKPVATTWH